MLRTTSCDRVILPHMPVMPHSETMIMNENLIMDSESLNNFPESGAINQTDICLALKLMLFSLYSTQYIKILSII